MAASGLLVTLIGQEGSSLSGLSKLTMNVKQVHHKQSAPKAEKLRHPGTLMIIISVSFTQNLLYTASIVFHKVQ